MQMKKAYMHNKPTHLYLAFHRGYPAGQVCRGCVAGCASCGRNATHCLSCDEPLLLHKHQCVEECPPAHTVQDRKCQHCPTACQECNPLGHCTGTWTRSKPGQILLLKLIQRNQQCTSAAHLSSPCYVIDSKFGVCYLGSRDSSVVLLVCWPLWLINEWMAMKFIV